MRKGELIPLHQVAEQGYGQPEAHATPVKVTSQVCIQAPPMMILQQPSGPALCFVPGYPGKRSAQHLKRDLGFGIEEVQGLRSEEGGGMSSGCCTCVPRLAALLKVVDRVEP